MSELSVFKNEINENIDQKMGELSSFKDDLNEKMDVVSLNQEKSFSKISEIEQKLNSFSGIGEEINSLKMQTANSIYQLSEDQEQIKKEILDNQKSTTDSIEELSEIQNQMKSDLLNNQKSTTDSIEKLSEIQNQMKSSLLGLSENQEQIKTELLISQEKVSRNVANDTFLKIQKMLAKKKKKPIKPQRAKLIRFLKKNFKIKSFSKVLVITDKRNSVFGKILYEATRNLSQKSVLAIMEDRTNKMNLDRHVIEAIKQSNYVFIIGQYSLKKVKEVSKNLRRKVKVMPIKRSLKFSIL
jgi:hypothetical protein